MTEQKKHLAMDVTKIIQRLDASLKRLPTSDRHLIWLETFTARVRARLANFFGITLVDALLRFAIFLLPQQAIVPIGNGLPVFLKPNLVASVTEPLPDRSVDHIGGHYISPYEYQRQRAIDELRTALEVGIKKPDAK